MSVPQKIKAPLDVLFDHFVSTEFKSNPPPDISNVAIEFVNRLGQNQAKYSLDSWTEAEWDAWGESIGLSPEQIEEVKEALAEWL